MPSRNILRYDRSDAYYHVYLRGVDRGLVFRGPEDKNYLLYLFSRHLSIEEKKTKTGYPYPHYRGQVELLAYCLMDNHFHLLVYQLESGALSRLMKSVLTAYTMYFNRTHKRSGPLFESRFKAVMVDQDSYLLHISRYIHSNPRSWKFYKFSSIGHYRKGTEPEWLLTEKVLSQFVSRKEYIDFVADYEAMRDTMAELKHHLADI